MSQESSQQPNDDVVVDQIAEFFASDNDEAPDKDSADGEVASGADIERGESGDSAQPDAATDDGVAEDSESGAGEDDTGEPERVTVSSLAEQLGVDAATLYNELEIPLPASSGGGSITLGEFKDRLPELQKLDSAKEAHADTVREHEKERLRDRALLNEMLALMGDQAKPLYEHAAKNLEQWNNQQRDLLLEHIPEWREPDAWARDRDNILTVTSEYGITEAELAMCDHRQLRLLKDLADLSIRAKSANTASKRSSAKPNGKGKANRTTQKGKLAAALARAKASANINDKTDGVEALLRSL